MRWTMLLAVVCLLSIGLGGRAQLISAEERALANARVDAELHRVLGRLLESQRKEPADSLQR